MDDTKKSLWRRLLESFARARTRQAQRQVETRCSTYCAGDQPDDGTEKSFTSR